MTKAKCKPPDKAHNGEGSTAATIINSESSCGRLDSANKLLQETGYGRSALNKKKILCGSCAHVMPRRRAETQHKGKAHTCHDHVEKMKIADKMEKLLTKRVLSSDQKVSTEQVIVSNAGRLITSRGSKANNRINKKGMICYASDCDHIVSGCDHTGSDMKAKQVQMSKILKTTRTNAKVWGCVVNVLDLNLQVGGPQGWSPLQVANANLLIKLFTNGKCQVALDDCNPMVEDGKWHCMCERSAKHQSKEQRFGSVKSLSANVRFPKSVHQDTKLLIGDKLWFQSPVDNVHKPYPVPPAVTEAMPEFPVVCQREPSRKARMTEVEKLLEGKDPVSEARLQESLSLLKGMMSGVMSHGIDNKKMIWNLKIIRDKMMIVKTLSGVGTHHQNGNAERQIGMSFGMARTMMPHAKMRWPPDLAPDGEGEALIIVNQEQAHEAMEDFNFVTGCSWQMLEALEQWSDLPNHVTACNFGAVSFGPLGLFSSEGDNLGASAAEGADQMGKAVVDTGASLTISALEDDFNSKQWTELFNNGKFQTAFDNDDPIELDDEWLSKSERLVKHQRAVQRIGPGRLSASLEPPKEMVP